MWLADYLADTSHLDATEHGIYHLLLYRYWLTDGRPLPEDIRVLRNIARCRTGDQVLRILKEFWELSTGEGWHHKRATIELRVTRDRKFAQSEKAKKRWKNNERPNAAAYPVHMPPTLTPTLLSSSSPLKTPISESKPTLGGKYVKSQSPKPKAKARPAFVKPTIEQVRSYCTERGKGVDPEAWVDHYASNGWRVGRNPMRDWKAAVRTWERNRLPAGGNGARPRRQSTEDRLRAGYERLGMTGVPSDEEHTGAGSPSGTGQDDVPAIGFQPRRRRGGPSGDSHG